MKSEWQRRRTYEKFQRRWRDEWTLRYSSRVWMWELGHKEFWALKNRCFWTVVIETTCESPWSNQSILKEISPEYSSEGLMLKLKLQYFGHLMLRTLVRKEPNGEKDWRQAEKGTTEDEIVGWHHQLDGCEFEQDSGVVYGQGGLVFCSPWGHRESDMTELTDWLRQKGEWHIGGGKWMPA